MLVPALRRDLHDDVANSPPTGAASRRYIVDGSAAVAPDYAPAAPPNPKQTTVPRKRRRTVSPYVALPVLGLMLLVAGMAFVAQRVQVMTMSYALIEAKAELTKLQQERTRLEAELAKSRSLERVERLARTRLGMVDPESTAVVVVAGAEAAAAAAADAGVEDGSSSPLTAIGEWLHSRLRSTAEAGGRWPDP